MGKRYIMNYKEDREKEIVKASMMGVSAHTILSIFKIVVGLIANSMVIVLDGVESMSNALGAVVTIIGIKLSGKAPDNKHPLGYGRVEFVTDLVVASFVIYIGMTAFIAGVKNIMNPRETTYSYATFIVLFTSSIVNFLLARHEKEVGKKFHARSLLGASVDSFANALVSMSILLSAFIHYKLNLHLESYIGTIISLLIMRGGIIIMRDTIKEVLGERVSTKLISAIESTILEFDGVIGVYDVLLHSYGRDRYIGSIHIEIPSSLSTLELDILERKISSKVYKSHGVVIAGISIYTMNVDDEESLAMYQFIKEYAASREDVLNVHGILIDKKTKIITFDIILECKAKQPNLTMEELKDTVQSKYKDYHVFIKNDIDF